MYVLPWPCLYTWTWKHNSCPLHVDHGKDPSRNKSYGWMEILKRIPPIISSRLYNTTTVSLRIVGQQASETNIDYIVAYFMERKKYWKCNNQQINTSWRCEIETIVETSSVHRQQHPLYIHTCAWVVVRVTTPNSCWLLQGGQNPCTFQTFYWMGIQARITLLC